MAITTSRGSPLPKATINDVASLAGVSIKTVSRVLNGEPNVRTSTQDKVKAAAQQLAYKPNPSARSLAGNKSYLMGLIYDNPSAAYVMDVQAGVLDACHELGYSLLIHPCHYQSPKLACELLALVEHSRLDGLILTPPLSEMKPLIAALDAKGVALARISPVAFEHDSPLVRSNDQQAAKGLIEHLIQLGHSDIAMVLGHPDHGGASERQLGYQQAMKQAGLPIKPQWLVQGDFSFESGEQGGRQLLALDQPPTAIFASNDYMAAGVAKVARQLKLALPEQLSIVGFDNAPISRQLWPALTTVSQPVKALAKSATEQLVQKVRGHKLAKANSEPLAADIIIRGSCAPPKQKGELNG